MRLLAVSTCIVLLFAIAQSDDKTSAKKDEIAMQDKDNEVVDVAPNDETEAMTEGQKDIKGQSDNKLDDDIAIKDEENEIVAGASEDDDFDPEEEETEGETGIKGNKLEDEETKSTVNDPHGGQRWTDRRGVRPRIICRNGLGRRRRGGGRCRRRTGRRRYIPPKTGRRRWWGKKDFSKNDHNEVDDEEANDPGNWERRYYIRQFRKYDKYGEWY